MKKLVELHGGQIWVESAGEGRESTFAFTLPLAPSGKAGEPEQGRPKTGLPPKEAVP